MATAWRLAEEIACYCLAIAVTEIDETLHLLEVYGIVCIRLVRLLKIERDAHVQLESRLKDLIDLAIRETTVDLGLP